MRERIAKLRDHIGQLNDAGVRRTTFYGLVADSLRLTVGEPRPIRRAKAFAHLLDRVDQVVLPHELLAGSILGMWPVAEGLPPYEARRREAIEVLDRFLRDKRETGRQTGGRRWGSMMLRDHYDANVSFADLQRLIAEMAGRYAGADITHREIGVLLEGHFQFDYGEETRRLFRELPWAAANHLDLNYGRVVRRGLSGIHAEILERLSAAGDRERRTFYESARIAVEAAIRFIERYAQTLLDWREMPGVDAARAAELAEMAAICRAVAARPPETFREALQLTWLTHVIANIGGGSALSFARFDQYLYPFYARDVLTAEDARELLSCLWLKVNEPHMRTVQSLCLAGVRPDGGYGANELTRLCLEVCREVAQPYPNVSVRVCSATPAWLWDEIAATMQAGIGHPMLLNDDVWVPNFERLGFPPEAARDYYNMGCVEMMIMGQTAEWRGPGGVDLPGVLELVFRNGETNLAGDTGPQTGTLDSLRTFEQFLDACIAQIRHRVRQNRAAAERQDAWNRGTRYDPFASALLDDCLERGLDLYQGGSRFPPIRPMVARGIATIADSLVAIKRLVFDERRLTLAELWDVLEADFEGHETLRVELERRLPAFGNDEAEVDAIAARVLAAYTDAVHALNDGSLPGVFVTGMFSYTSHISIGEVTAATANGRRRGEAVSNGIGASQGKDVRGPTATINSVTALDHARITGACAFNLKLTPSLVRREEGADALKGLLKTYVAQGGCQIQVTVVDQQDLRDAQERPERHRDLIVRVAGYSEYFNNLDRQLQDEIIARTAHAV